MPRWINTKIKTPRMLWNRGLFKSGLQIYKVIETEKQENHRGRTYATEIETFRRINTT